MRARGSSTSRSLCDAHCELCTDSCHLVPRLSHARVRFEPAQGQPTTVGSGMDVCVLVGSSGPNSFPYGMFSERGDIDEDSKRSRTRSEPSVSVLKHLIMICVYVGAFCLSLTRRRTSLSFLWPLLSSSSPSVQSSAKWWTMRVPACKGHSWHAWTSLSCVASLQSASSQVRVISRPRLS